MNEKMDQLLRQESTEEQKIEKILNLFNLDNPDKSLDDSQKKPKRLIKERAGDLKIDLEKIEQEEEGNSFAVKERVREELVYGISEKDRELKGRKENVGGQEWELVTVFRHPRAHGFDPELEDPYTSELETIWRWKNEKTGQVYHRLGLPKDPIDPEIKKPDDAKTQDIKHKHKKKLIPQTIKNPSYESREIILFLPNTKNLPDPPKNISMRHPNTDPIPRYFKYLEKHWRFITAANIPKIPEIEQKSWKVNSQEDYEFITAAVRVGIPIEVRLI